MRLLGTHNFGAYARKLLIDGYIIKVDYTEQKKLAVAVSCIASNVNQICRQTNSTGHFYEDDIAELKSKAQEEIQDAQHYFEVAEQSEDHDMMCEFICMAKEELGHAGKLYGMATKM